MNVYAHKQMSLIEPLVVQFPLWYSSHQFDESSNLSLHLSADSSIHSAPSIPPSIDANADHPNHPPSATQVIRYAKHYDLRIYFCRATAVKTHLTFLADTLH